MTSGLELWRTGRGGDFASFELRLHLETQSVRRVLTLASWRHALSNIVPMNPIQVAVIGEVISLLTQPDKLTPNLEDPHTVANRR